MEKERGSQAAHMNGRAPRALSERLVLASASPRRAEILRAVGWDYEIVPAEIDETARGGESPSQYVERLAREKAEKVAGARLLGIVLGADTVVVANDGRVLGKPRDAADATRMLATLSGNWHEVLTGIALVRAETRACAVAHVSTRVRFAALSDEEIAWYVATDEPLDKAGAYAVQGRAALFIEEIKGDYWNVVGLPVNALYKLMREFAGG